MSPSSLRLRLLLVWAIFIVVLIQIAGIGLRVLFERSITRRTQLELSADLRQIKRGMEIQSDGTMRIARQPTDPQFEIPFGGRYWQVAEGALILARSKSLKDERLNLPEHARMDITSAPLWLEGPERQRLFAVVEDFSPKAVGETKQRQFRITTAVDASEIREDTDKFSSDLYTSLITLAALLFAGAFVHVTIGLHPLEDLRSRLAAVRQGKDKQIEGAFPSEIMPLVSEANELLAAQQSALSAARQRAGDLAHGLNTPLAVMNAKSRELRRAGHAQIADDIDRQVDLMRRHVERELARTRARGGRRTDYGNVDATLLLDPLISALQGLPRGQSLEWRINMPMRFEMFVDADDLNNMAGNLLENALKWAKNRIDVTAEHSGNASKLMIDDDGPGIPQSEIERVLQRGERADESITGTGLGLAIVCDLVDLYGGRLTLSRSALGGLRAELYIPER